MPPMNEFAFFQVMVTSVLTAFSLHLNYFVNFIERLNLDGSCLGKCFLNCFLLITSVFEGELWIRFYFALPSEVISYIIIQQQYIIMDSRAQFQIRKNYPILKASSTQQQQQQMIKTQPKQQRAVSRQANQRNTVISQITNEPQKIVKNEAVLPIEADISFVDKLVAENEKLKNVVCNQLTFSQELAQYKSEYKKVYLENKTLKRENQGLKIQLERHSAQGEEQQPQQFDVQDAYSLMLAMRMQEREQQKIQYYQFMQEAMHPQTVDENFVNVDNMTYEQLLALEDKMGVVSRGLTKEQIESIPETVISLNNKSQLPELCSICYGDFKMSEKFSQLKCRHFYHDKCIKQWLTNEKKCPICKDEVTT